MGAVSPSHWIILIIVGLLILFVFNGSRKIPEIARGLGRGARIFKSEFHELKNDDAKRNESADSAVDYTRTLDSVDVKPGEAATD